MKKNYEIAKKNQWNFEKIFRKFYIKYGSVWKIWEISPFSPSDLKRRCQDFLIEMLLPDNTEYVVPNHFAMQKLVHLPIFFMTFSKTTFWQVWPLIITDLSWVKNKIVKVKCGTNGKSSLSKKICECLKVVHGEDIFDVCSVCHSAHDVLSNDVKITGPNLSRLSETAKKRWNSCRNRQQNAQNSIDYSNRAFSNDRC